MHNLAAPLEASIQTWRRRLALRRGLRRAAWATLGGFGAVAAFALVALAVPVPAGALGSPAVIIALGVALIAIAASIAAATARFSPADAAQIADLRHDTGALFTTAWDAAQRADAELTEAQRACIAEANDRAAALAAREIAPLRFGWRWATLALYAAAAALTLLPFAEDTQAAIDALRLDAAAEELEKVEKRLEEQPEEAAQLDPALRKELRRLQRELKQGDLTSREALEQVGELKRKLRAEKLTQDARANQTGRGAREAARELGRSSTTSPLAQRLAEQGRDPQGQAATPEERKEQAERAAQALRKLEELKREERGEAGQTLEKGAEAATKAGDPQLGQLLKQAAEAVESGDNAKLDQLSQDLQKALEQASENQQNLEELAKALDNAQQRLAGVDPSPGQPQPGQGRTGEGEGEGQGPGQRNWSKGDGKGQPNMGAGTGHQDERAGSYDVKNQHNDADRTANRTPEEKETDYRALYESANLDDSLRILTRVNGEKSGDSTVGSSKGGQQTPGTERAQLLLQQLPTQYAEDAQRAVNTEEIPPAYRDAVRDYFDANKR